MKKRSKKYNFNKSKNLNNVTQERAINIFQGLLDSHSLSFEGQTFQQFRKLGTFKRGKFITQFVNKLFTEKQINKLEYDNNNGNNANLRSLGFNTKIRITDIKTSKRSKNVTPLFKVGSKKREDIKEGNRIEQLLTDDYNYKKRNNKKQHYDITGPEQVKQDNWDDEDGTPDSLLLLLFSEYFPGTPPEQIPEKINELIQNGVDQGKLTGKEVLNLINLKELTNNYLNNKKVLDNIKSSPTIDVNLLRHYTEQEYLTGEKLREAIYEYDSNLTALSNQYKDYKQHEYKSINGFIKDLEKNRF